MVWGTASAWLVHLYTASGALIAFLTLSLFEQSRFHEALWLMFLAAFIDMTDGALARLARVKERIPWFDGARLDDIVDYLNYVFVPAVFLIRADLLPTDGAMWLAALPLLASAYGFCQKEAKTSDHFFLGFPSYWNVVVVYFYVLQTPLWLNVFFIVGFSILVFVPTKYLYPSRSPVLRIPTLGLGILWGVSILIIIYLLPHPPRLLVYASLVFPAYYMLLSFWVSYRRTLQ